MTSFDQQINQTNENSIYSFTWVRGITSGYVQQQQDGKTVAQLAARADRYRDVENRYCTLWSGDYG
jgi:hypothetical protein